MSPLPFLTKRDNKEMEIGNTLAILKPDGRIYIYSRNRTTGDFDLDLECGYEAAVEHLKKEEKKEIGFKWLGLRLFYNDTQLGEIKREGKKIEAFSMGLGGTELKEFNNTQLIDARTWIETKAEGIIKCFKK